MSHPSSHPNISVKSTEQRIKGKNVKAYFLQSLLSKTFFETFRQKWCILMLFHTGQLHYHYLYNILSQLGGGGLCYFRKEEIPLLSSLIFKCSDCSAEQRYCKFRGPIFWKAQIRWKFWAEMNFSRVACYPLVSHFEYVQRALLRLKNKTDRQTDGRTDRSQTITSRLSLDATRVITEKGSKDRHSYWTDAPGGCRERASVESAWPPSAKEEPR